MKYMYIYVHVHELNVLKKTMEEAKEERKK